MNYKVTKLYLKSKEALIAAFLDFNDATLFITTQLTQDELNRTKTLYRVYDESELVRQFNNETQVFPGPEDTETFGNAQFSVEVKIQAQNSVERIRLACFNEEEHAIAFITAKCSRNNNIEYRESFLIFKNHLLIRTLNKTIIEHKALRDLSVSEKGSGATLSPLSTRPTPQGGPRDYWVEKKDDVE